jgi:hypothetical protein
MWIRFHDSTQREMLPFLFNFFFFWDESLSFNLTLSFIRVKYLHFSFLYSQIGNKIYVLNCDLRGGSAFTRTCNKIKHLHVIWPTSNPTDTNIDNINQNPLLTIMITTT